MEDIHAFITVREASKMTGYNPDYLSSLIRTGKIRGHKLGRGWVTTKADVNAYFKLSTTSASSVSVAHNLKLGSLIFFISIIVTSILTVGYFTVYEHGYQEAHAQDASKTTTTTSIDAPIDY